MAEIRDGIFLVSAGDGKGIRTDVSRTVRRRIDGRVFARRIEYDFSVFGLYGAFADFYGDFRGDFFSRRVGDFRRGQGHFPALYGENPRFSAQIDDGFSRIRHFDF